MGGRGPLIPDVRDGLDTMGTQILTLEECQKSCNEYSDCNLISFQPYHNYCWLHSKDEACDDSPCDWTAGLYVYMKNCGNFFDICFVFKISLVIEKFFKNF